MSNGQNVEWDKTPKRYNVESNKGRMGHNVEWDKMLTINNIEWDKMSIEIMSNGTKHLLLLFKLFIAGFSAFKIQYQTSNDKMSNGTKCRIVYV